MLQVYAQIQLIGKFVKESLPDYLKKNSLTIFLGVLSSSLLSYELTKVITSINQSHDNILRKDLIKELKANSTPIIQKQHLDRLIIDPDTIKEGKKDTIGYYIPVLKFH